MTQSAAMKWLRNFPAVCLPATLLLLISSLPAAAQEAPSFDDSTTVVVVEVPVNVHLDGKTVRGLTRGDFEVLEGRQPRELVGFEVVDLAMETGRSTAQESRPRIPIAARRHFLLFFDLTAGGLQGLQGARDLVDSGLHPQDLVGVGVYGRAGAGLLLGFTPDHGQVLAVLDRLGSDFDTSDGKDSEKDPTLLARRDPLRLMPDTRAIDIAREALEMDTGGRGSGAEVYFEMNRSNISQGRSRARAEVGRFSEALSTLADATARIDGRKFLVLFSAGFDDDVFFEEETLTRRSLLDSRQGSTALRDLQRMTDRFVKAGWTIQSVDSAGLQEGRNLSGGTSLALLANETGGETYRSFNHLSGAMDQMLDKTSVTYLLAFRADNVSMDGAFHKIKVRLPNGPRGARLIHRPGYHAPKPFDSEDEGADATADRFSVAEMLLSGENSGSFSVDFLPVSFRQKDATRTFTWIHATGLEALPSDQPFNLELFAYVLDASQRVLDFSVRSFTLDPTKAGPRLVGGGLQALMDFDLPAGTHDLRLLVREPQSGRHALIRAPFEVPSLEETAPALLPPLLLDDELKGVVVRPQADDGTSDDYPFIAGESEQFVPGVHPALAPGKPVRVCLMGYHLTRADLTLNIEVYDVTDLPAGERIDQQRVELVGRSETRADGLDRLYFNLNTAGLASGNYELRASIANSGDGSSQVVASPFRIGG